ncbi:hypothetical protein VTH82DRAFT_6969 [Thermothelomyces myriococcoides]
MSPSHLPKEGITSPSPHPLRVLIAGAGIAGPALALSLSKLRPQVQCSITIVERHPGLRASGQQVDLRGAGVQAMRKLGIEREVRAAVVDEPGVRILDWRKGAQQAFFGRNDTGKGRQTFSAEWEIMRGDLCRLLYDATCHLPGVQYRFGITIDSWEHVRGGRAVRARLTDGTEAEYDLIVGADGLGSRVRRLMLAEGKKKGESDNNNNNNNNNNNEENEEHNDGRTANGLVPVGITCAFFTVPPEPGDSSFANFCHYPGRRWILTRRDRPDCLRVYMGYAGSGAADERFSHVIRHGTVAEQKDAWTEVFAHDLADSWGVRRFLDGMRSPQADDFYTQEFAQVRIDRWRDGRVVLLGDAGFCPAPVSGQGTSLALIGAYILAGEIARACVRSSGTDVDDNNNNNREGDNRASKNGDNEPGPWDNIPAALAAYETTLRPLVKQVQDISFNAYLNIFCPDKPWVIKTIHWIMWIISALRIDQLAARFSSDEEYTWELPDYPELVSSPKA